MIENLLIGILSGVISGLIVSCSIWLLGYLRKPPLELVFAGDQRAVLKNNRLRPVVIGGAWEFENGDVLYRPDGFRGGNGGFYIPRLGQFVVGTSHFGPGQTADVAYKYVKSPRDSDARIRLEESNKVEASEVAINPEKYPEWLLARVILNGAV